VIELAVQRHERQSGRSPRCVRWRALSGGLAPGLVRTGRGERSQRLSGAQAGGVFLSDRWAESVCRVTDCVWTLRNGRRCGSVALVGDYCPGHARMQDELVSEAEKRAARGQAPMSVRERDVFLRQLRHERKAERDRLALARASEAIAA
jgi:hypothetical protein